jgi:DNA replication protein DnaC
VSVDALLKELLKQLRLPTIAENFGRMAEEARSNKVGHLEYLCCLLELELQHRAEKKRRECLSDAKFPTVKSLDSFQFEEIPSLNKALVLKLFGGQYLAAGENVVLIGGQGTGKTHLSIALGVQACNAGKTVRFYTVADLVHQLVEARDQKQVLNLQQKLSKIELLILDELGRVECNQDQANLLFQVIASRYERKSTIISSNLEFKDWSSVFVTQNLTSALLDRLIHRCHILEVNGESYRFKESIRRKKSKEKSTQPTQKRSETAEESGSD